MILYYMLYMRLYAAHPVGFPNVLSCFASFMAKKVSPGIFPAYKYHVGWMLTKGTEQ